MHLLAREKSFLITQYTDIVATSELAASMRAQLQAQPISYTLSFAQRRHDPEWGCEDLDLTEIGTAESINHISRGTGVRRSQEAHQVPCLWSFQGTMSQTITNIKTCWGFVTTIADESRPITGTWCMGRETWLGVQENHSEVEACPSGWTRLWKVKPTPQMGPWPSCFVLGGEAGQAFCPAETGGNLKLRILWLCSI